MKSTQNTILLICTLIWFGCKQSISNGNQSISIKKTNETYSFEASYPENKTQKVQAYLEKTLNEDGLFAGIADRKDSEISLGDTVKFHMKSELGYLLIEFKKQQNSFTAYQKLEKACLGVKEMLK